MGRVSDPIKSLEENKPYRFRIPVGTRRDKIVYLNNLLEMCNTYQNLFWLLVEKSMELDKNNSNGTQFLHNDNTLPNKVHNYNTIDTQKDINRNTIEKNKLNKVLNYDTKDNQSQNNNDTITSTLLAEDHKSDIIATQKPKIISRVSSNAFK